MLIFTLLACQEYDLDPEYIVDRTRVLGARSEPAEPRPGDQVTLESLSVDPENGISGVIWFGCVIEQAGGFGCELDYAALEELMAMDPSTMSPAEQLEWFQALQEAGFLGFEPDLAPSFKVPADLLDGLSDEEKLEGLSYFITLNALPGGTEELALNDEAEVEVAYKRVVVSEAATPNHNPAIKSILVEDDLELRSGDTLHVVHGQTYAFELLLEDDAVETYTYRTSEGTDEERIEEPYIKCYSTVGDFDQSFSLYPYLQFEWTAPVDPPAPEQHLWVVVRDRRGGMEWLELVLVVD